MNVKTCALFHILVLAGSLAMGGPLKVGFSVDAYSVVEEDASASITVQLTKTTHKTVTVDYMTSDGTATGGVDYTQVSGTLTFVPGQTSETFTVPIIDDSEAEFDETVNLTLSNSSNAQLGASAAVLTILDPVDGDPQAPPNAQISAPEDQSTFVEGDLITMDGSTSTVPAGFQVWFAALDANSGPPMTALHEGSTLSENFNAAAGIDAYTIRLVIADSQAMPTDAELRGAALPCEGTALCDSAEISITRTDGPPPEAPYFLTAIPLSSVVVKLTWVDNVVKGSTFNVYRGPSPGELTSIELGLPAGQTTYYDTGLTLGARYYYQVKNSRGSSAEVPATMPTSDATYLSLLPAFDVEWPGGFSHYHDDKAIVTLSLQPEDATWNPTSHTVSLFVDEPTFEDLPRPPAFPTDFFRDDFEFEPGFGRDDVSYVNRKETPDQELVVNDPGMIAFSMPDLSYGQHTFRVVVTDLQGISRERAFLWQVVKPDGFFGGPRFAGAGKTTNSKRPFLFGYGPPSRPSPDGHDKDQRYYAQLGFKPRETDTCKYNLSRRHWIFTDENGYWEFDPEEDLHTFLGGGDEIDGCLSHWCLHGCNGNPVPSGRDFPLAGGGTLDISQTTLGRADPGGTSYYQSFSLDIVGGGGNPAPVFDSSSLPETIIAASTDPVVTYRLSFRVTDLLGDLDLHRDPDGDGVPEPVRIINNNNGGSFHEAWMSPDQTGVTEDKNYGYWEANIPLVQGANELCVEAYDLAGHPVDSPDCATVNRIVPEVVAHIASPGPSTWNSHALIHLDGSTSEGPPGMETRWVFLLPHFSMAGVPNLEASTLETDIEMPEVYRGLMARLVVATPGNLPADLYTYGLPCNLEDSNGQCDSIQIQLNNSCCTSSGCDGAGAALQLDILEPGNGAHLPFNQVTTLQAEASGVAGATFAYRWSIAEIATPDNRTVLTPLGSDQTGFDPTHALFNLDPVAEGLSFGAYVLFAEAGLVDEFNCSWPPCCIGSIVEQSIVVDFSHVLSAIAPGHSFPSDTIRIYGETFTVGQEILVRIDDESDHGIVAYEFLATVADGQWVEIPLPADMPEGVLYYLAVAASDGQGESAWKQALEVVHPGYNEPGVDDPSCTGIGQEAANPIVPGQVVTGDFCDAGDTDYFYFSAAAGTTFDVFLERADQTSPVFLPSVPDPELFIVDPQGLVDATYGYADNISSTNPDAAVIGFVAPKSGLYALACKTSKGWGGYSLTLSRTSTPTSDGFTVVPYGPRSITVAEHDGELLPTVSLQAMVFDPVGIPAAGASLDWNLQNGTAPDQSVIMSNGWGIGQGNFIQPSGSLAELLPTFDFPMAKGGFESMPIGVPVPGAIAGLVTMDPNAVILESRLPGKAEISRLGTASERAQRLARDSGQLPEKILSQCPDPEALKQVLVSISNPCGATFLSGIQLEILDALGDPIDVPVTGLTVTEREIFQASLAGTCKDGIGNLTDITIADAKVVLAVADLDPAYTRGIVTGGTTCPTAVISTSGAADPFELELGTRSIFTDLDVNGDPEFASVEMLFGETRVVAFNSSGGWSTWADSTSEELAPESREPYIIDWIHDPNLAIPTDTLMYLEYNPGQNATFQNGPELVLLDEFNNVVVQWGKDDTQWHRNALDEIYIQNPGTEGAPPWAGISFEPLSDPLFYNPIQFSSVFFTGTSAPGSTYGLNTWNVCVNTTENGTICSPWGIDNSGALNWIYTLWPFIGNETTSPYGEEYVSVDDWYNLASATTQPGKPLRFAISGKPWAVRVDPMLSDDLGQPHNQHFTDVDVTIWVNGPNSGPTQIRWTRTDPTEDWQPVKVDDVEITPGSLVGTGGTDLDLILDEASAGSEIVLTTFTDTVGVDGVLDPGEALGAAFSITKAPAEPGWYTIVVETDDPRFPEYAQHNKNWTALTRLSVHSFLVEEEPEPDNSCSLECEECAAGEINLGTGNTHFRDGDPIAGLPEFLTSRAHDSMNTDDGFFGQGWISALDARTGAQTGGAKSGGSPNTVDITTETGHKLRFVTDDGVNFLQTRPAGKVRNTLKLESGNYILTLEGNAFDRSFNATSGWLTTFVQRSTGRTFTVNRDASGTPLDITDSWKGVVADFVVTGGQITEITTPTQVFGFDYNGDATLSNVTLDSVTTRSYTYAGDAQLTEIYDGAGRTLESHGFSSGAAASVISASKDVTGVEWGISGPRAALADEMVTRVDKASGSSTYYYQRWIGDRYRVTEIRGDCDCSGNDRVYGYDDSGKRILEQDARGYITRYTYLTDGRKTSDERGLRQAACDPALYPDPTACRLNPEELAALTAADLVASEAFTSRTYTYGDSNWPNKPTTICSPSVFSDGFPTRTSCADITYDSSSGEWVTRSETGWTGISPASAVQTTNASSRIFNDGISIPSFDPGGAFSAAWLSLAQPAGLLQSVDGPRTDVSDVTQYVYYPVDASVPTNARGRLAAVKDALGYITSYEDYDEWGNAQRVIDPNGVISDRTFDAVGRTLTSTVVAGGGCDPVVDPLCTTNLVTTYTYQPGYGSLESVTSPGGSVSVTSYDAYGRVLTTGRGPSLGEITEQTEAEYDPTTLQKTRDSRLASDGLGDWTEHSRTTFVYDTNGHLQTRLLPRSATDPTPAEEHYTYDAAGNVSTFRDPNHAEPNVSYVYDPLGRMVEVSQLMDPTALPGEQDAVTDYAYDSRGNLVSVIDANGNTTTYVVDDFGRTTRITSPRIYRGHYSSPSRKGYHQEQGSSLIGTS